MIKVKEPTTRHVHETKHEAPKTGKTAAGATVKHGTNAVTNLNNRLKMYFKVGERNWFNSNEVKGRLESLNDKEIRALKAAFDHAGSNLEDKKVIYLKDHFLIPLIHERSLRQFGRHFLTQAERKDFEKDLSPKQLENIVRLADSSYDFESLTNYGKVKPKEVKDFLKNDDKVSELLRKQPPPSQTTSAAGPTHQPVPQYDKDKYHEFEEKIMEEMVALDPKKRDKDTLHKKYRLKESFFEGCSEKQMRLLLEKKEAAKGIAFLLMSEQTKPNYHHFAKNVEEKGKNSLDTLVEAGKTEEGLQSLHDYNS